MTTTISSAQKMYNTSAYNTTGGYSTTIHRPAVDVAVERVALGLLRWSRRHAVQVQPSHERMALLLENERAITGGSSLGR